MRAYALPRDHILFELPSVEGWACLAAAVEGDPWTNAQRASSGYIAQELDRL